MDVNALQVKNGWIFVARQLAAQLPDPATIAALTPIATPASATAQDCATKINAIIAALKDLS